MRIVIDTNVFVSACIGRGASSEVVEACLLDRVTPVISKSLYIEYEDVLDRAEIFRRARLTATERDTLFDVFLGKFLLIDVYYRWRPNLRDEGDNHLIELAVAGNAEKIVTNNLRDFQNPELKFDHVSIVTPEGMLAELRR
jgi:putative PIN family toxin of toxin-antitoxin system